MDWYVPEMRKEKVSEKRGIDAPDTLLMWVIKDCKKCSERDRKIAQIILDARLKELEDLM